MGYEEKCNLSYPMHITDTAQFLASLSRIPRKEQKREQEIWWTILEI